MQLGRLVGSLSQDLGRSPTPAEIAARAGVPEEEVLEAMEAGGMYRLVSLDGSLTDDDDAPELSLQLGDDDAGFERVEQHAELSELLAVLPERERTIVILRFFDGLTQSEIAARVGISQMHVSRLLSRSLDALRSQVAS